MPLIYLAGAIDKKKTVPYAWASKLVIALADHWRGARGWADSLMVYNPYAAFDGSIGPPNQRDAEKLVSANASILSLTDLMIVHYESDQETWGTSQEVLLASNMDKPILVWANDEMGISFPTYLIAHMKHPFAMPYAHQSTVAKAAVNYLIEQMLEEENGDNLGTN